MIFRIYIYIIHFTCIITHYIYIYMCVCVCIYIYICIYIYVYIYYIYITCTAPGPGKGGKGGKGDRKGGPPSSDELPETRRDELCPGNEDSKECWEKDVETLQKYQEMVNQRDFTYESDC